MAFLVRRYVSIYYVSDIITLGIFCRPQSLKERGEKSWQKFRLKMPQKQIRCCKNYPQTGRIIQLQFVEIKPAKTYRKHRENCTYRSNFLERLQKNDLI